MKNIKAIFLGIGMAAFAFLGVVLYVNLSQPVDDAPPHLGPTGSNSQVGEGEWWQSTTIYQVYPRSFQDSDGDGIGDLAGVISRLDYIQDLGFQTVWLSPFFRSPQEDFGYDISDYNRCAPEYGTDSLVDTLIAEVHKRNMKVVFDLVLNHTSDQHPWFLESRMSADNPRSHWYVWADGDGQNPPNNWLGVLGNSGWNFSKERNQWYYASFLPFQPDLNWRNPEVKEAMFNMVKYWLDKGVDGFRLDIFNFIYEDPELRDNPFTFRFLPDPSMERMFFQERRYTLNLPETFQLAKELRVLVDSYSPSRFLVGEVFGKPTTLRALLGEEQDGLNLVFLFDITHFTFEADFFRQKILSFEKNYPAPYVPTYVFSNHDISRSFSRLGNDIRKAKLLALMQMTLRGTICTYQGEEIGMPSAKIPTEKALDPIAQQFNWVPKSLASSLDLFLNRDNCRTPMQWSNSINAGFSRGTNTWLPVQGNFPDINVEAQLSDPHSLLRTYQELLTIRKEFVALKWGSLDIVEEPNAELVHYSRKYGDQLLEIYLNFGESPITLFTVHDILFTTGAKESNEGQITLSGYSGLITRGSG